MNEAVIKFGIELYRAFDYYTKLIWEMEQFDKEGNQEMSDKKMAQVSACNHMFKTMGILAEAQAYKNEKLERRRKRELAKQDVKELEKLVRQCFSLSKQYGLDYRIKNLKEYLQTERNGIIEEHRFRTDLELEDRRREP